MIFLYQFGSLSSERMVSKDSKNGFGFSVAAIQTHSEPLKVVASTVFYSIEAKHFLASKMVEMNFLLYKMCCKEVVVFFCHPFVVIEPHQFSIGTICSTSTSPLKSV